MNEVLFVQMPFASVERPSLALGLLASALREDGIPVGTVYANIAFAETVGLASYFLVGQCAPHMLVGDWLFSPAAFGPAADGRRLPVERAHLAIDDRTLAEILEERQQADLAGLLEGLRRRAESFVDEVTEQILAARPRVVGCTSMFDQHVASLALLTRIKTRAPEILTVIGGANCAGVMGRATHLSFPGVDFTVTGEFDAYAVDFFRALCDSGGCTEDVALPPNVLGPGDRQADPAQLVRTPILVVDMDTTAVPDYDDYFDQMYASSLSPYVVPTLPFETSRGCWWGAKQHCTFCGLNAEGMAFRRKSPGRAVDEIRTLTSRYGTCRCAAADNIIDMSYFETVLPQLSGDGQPYALFYETKANLSRHQVAALAAAGCTVIQPGIESLHDGTLRLMRKGTTACQNIQLLKYCLELGVAPAWNILCNFPGSDPAWVADVARDFESLFHLFPPLGTTPIRFDRFSPYHQRPEEYGLSLAPMPSYQRVYPLPAETVGDLAYFFYDTRGISPEVKRNAEVSEEMARRWRAAFAARDRPHLVVEEATDDRVCIFDTRPKAAESRHELRGPAATVLRVLDTPVGSEGLARRLTESSPSLDPADARRGLAELLERRLVWRSSTQYVGLAVPPPCRPVPDLAVGMVDIRRFLESRRPTGAILV